AEDGIRDCHVTGVQTCALPIFKPDETFRVSLYSRDEFALKNAVAAFWCAIKLGSFGSRARRGAGSLAVYRVAGDTYGFNFMTNRSEERRVGKGVDWQKARVGVS